MQDQAVMQDQSAHYDELQLKPTLEEVDIVRKSRERFGVEDDEIEQPIEIAPPRLSPRVDALKNEFVDTLTSSEAHDLLIDFEVAGRRGYETRYPNPLWPGGASGVTIGIGYDLGYNTREQFEQAWRPYLSPDDFQALLATVGRKGAAASTLIGSMRHIVISWDAANAVYRKVSAPQFAKLVIATYPPVLAFPAAGQDSQPSARLHPHCFGALFSLIYNRGPDLNPAKPKRAEMRNILTHLTQGTIDRIPHELRAMKQHWGPRQSGLWRRRDAEANLFERGLIEAQRQSHAAVQAIMPAQPGHPVGATLTEALGGRANGPAETFRPPDEEGDGRNWPDADYDPEPDGPRRQPEAAPPWQAVSWVDSDDQSPDYRHIIAADRDLRDAAFTLTARDLELLIRANAFEPERALKRIIFGLRGATLDHDTASPGDGHLQVGRQGLRLRVCRPNHVSFRCVIGVWDLETDRLSGFIASTVPNRAAVHSYQQHRESGNMLATGCYRYIVGTHKRRFRGCLRPRDEMAVLRSTNDLRYDVSDDLVPGWPWDNIHPAFRDASGSAQFSSWGCQVIRGSGDGNGNYSGEFARFRAALGLKAPGQDDGTLYSYVLLTGHEAAIAERLRRQGRDTDPVAVRNSLSRLRQGSRGELVARLQDALKLRRDGNFTSATAKALAREQASRDRAADGIYSPALDPHYQLEVFGPLPSNPAAPPAILTAQAPSMAESSSGAQASGRPRSEDALFYELGRRLEFAQMQPELVNAEVLPHYEAVTTESLAGFMRLGRRFFERVERMAHDLICGDGEADKEDRQKIQNNLQDALGVSRDKAVEVLSGALTGFLAIPPIVARPVAEIIIGRVVQPAVADIGAAVASSVQAQCAVWGRTIYRRSTDGNTANAAAASPAARPASG